MFENVALIQKIGGIIWLILTMLIFVSILGGQDKFIRIVIYIILWVATIFIFDLQDKIPFIKD